jgi:DNA-binding NarL/FixJ family response regulator
MVYKMAEKILVVDDEYAVRKMLAKFLKGDGYSVDTSKTVIAAVKLMERNIYDIMLIYKNMPGTDGNPEAVLDLLRHVKSHSPSTDIIIITRYPNAETTWDAMHLGSFDYIVKPFHMEDLRLKISKLSKYRSFVKQVEEQNAALRAKTANLEETNTALKVLLMRVEKDRKEMEESITSDLRKLIFPYLDRMEHSDISKEQFKVLVRGIKGTFDKSISPFIKFLSGIGLSPTEIRIAEMIAAEKINKEIAHSLSLSEGTVRTHRTHIRKKLGLTNQKTNLQTYLRSLS